MNNLASHDKTYINKGLTRILKLYIYLQKIT